MSMEFESHREECLVDRETRRDVASRSREDPKDLGRER